MHVHTCNAVIMGKVCTADTGLTTVLELWPEVQERHSEVQEREVEVVERQLEVLEWRSGPFRLNLTAASAVEILEVNSELCTDNWNRSRLNSLQMKISPSNHAFGKLLASPNLECLQLWCLSSCLIAAPRALNPNCWRHGSVVRTSVFCWQTLPDLCLICGWHVTTSWVICPLWVNQPAFHPSEVGKWVVTHVITWIYGGGDHQTAVQGCVRMFGSRSKSLGAGLAYGL